MIVFRLVVVGCDEVTSVSGRFMDRDGMVVGRAGDPFDNGDVVSGEFRVELRLVAAATAAAATIGISASVPVDDSDVDSGADRDVDNGVESVVGIDKGRLTGTVWLFDGSETAGKLPDWAAVGELVCVAIRLQIDRELGFFFFKSNSSSDGGKTVCCMKAVQSGFKPVETSWELMIILKNS